MISLRRAFTSLTTTKAVLQLISAGHWNDNNQWIPGGASSSIPIQITPLPAGDKSDSTFGEALQARQELERKPVHMKFLSRTEMPINSILQFRGGNYKIIRYGDYASSGFHSVIGIRLLNLDISPFEISYSYEEDGKVIQETIPKGE